MHLYKFALAEAFAAHQSLQALHVLRSMCIPLQASSTVFVL